MAVGRGGKGDDGTEQPDACASSDALIEDVRAQLEARDPDRYNPSTWEAPASRRSTTTTSTASTTRSCAGQHLRRRERGHRAPVLRLRRLRRVGDRGRVFGKSIEPDQSGLTSLGMRDVVVTSMDECTAFAQAFAFDGGGFVGISFDEYQACGAE